MLFILILLIASDFQRVCDQAFPKKLYCGSSINDPFRTLLVRRKTIYHFLWAFAALFTKRWPKWYKNFCWVFLWPWTT